MSRTREHRHLGGSGKSPNSLETSGHPIPELIHQALCYHCPISISRTSGRMYGAKTELAKREPHDPATTADAEPRHDVALDVCRRRKERKTAVFLMSSVRDLAPPLTHRNWQHGEAVWARGRKSTRRKAQEQNSAR